MKFLKTHYGRAIDVIQSDTVNIPNPAGLGLEGVTDGTDTNKLVDSTASFTTNLLGAIVVSNGSSMANVIGFESSTVLILDADILQNVGDKYAIYNSDNNQGCAIYIPAATPAKLTVLTVGGDIVSFKTCGDLNAGSILPVNVLKVFKTDTEIENLIALW